MISAPGIHVYEYICLSQIKELLCAPNPYGVFQTSEHLKGAQRLCPWIPIRMKKLGKVSHDKPKAFTYAELKTDSNSYKGRQRQENSSGILRKE